MVSVRYIGSWADHSGYGEANRMIILALHTAGVDLITERLEQTTKQANYGKAFQIAASLENRQTDGERVRIIHLTPNLYIKYLDPNKYHIGHLFWETDKLPKSWVWNCNRMDEIWTGCEKQKQVIINSGVRVPVYVFPQPMITELDFKPRPYKIPHFDGFLFYSIFEWIERKNPQALIKAFYEEFSRTDNVGLLIKTYRNSFSEDNKQFIRNAVTRLKPNLQTTPRIFLYEDLLNEREIYRLHATGNCFISTSRGEGWNRPQTEAMFMARPVISNNTGGLDSYLDETNCFLVSNTKEPVILDSMSESYESDQNWYEVNIDELKTIMRFVFENYTRAVERAKSGQKFIIDNFNLMKVGTMMKDRLDIIEKELI